MLGIDSLNHLADNCLRRALGNEEVDFHLQDPVVDNDVPAVFERLNAAFWRSLPLFGKLNKVLRVDQDFSLPSCVDLCLLFPKGLLFVVGVV